MALIDSIAEKIELAVAAQEAGDFPTALTYARSAQLLLAGSPNLSIAGRNITWDRNSIRDMVSTLRKLASAQAGIGQIPVRYSGINGEDCGC